ncbi:unnamed protein product, partial [Prorocentrum cordatum]
VIYENVTRRGNIGGVTSFMYHITAGIVQGCPASGLLFSLALDPFLQDFRSVVDGTGRGHTRACADDIGMALKCISALSEISAVFRKAQRLAHLKLKIPKCHIVPLIDSASPEVIHQYRLWLGTHLPGWTSMGISGKLKYLGMFLGPDVEWDSWHAPLSKYQSRCALIAAGGSATE